MGVGSRECLAHALDTDVGDDPMDHPERRLVAVALRVVGLLVPDDFGKHPLAEPDEAGVVAVRGLGEAAVLTAHRLLHPPGVLLGEALVDPAVHEQGIVEPRVRCLVDDRYGIEVLADVDALGTR